MKKYLKTISLPDELWVQIDDTDYWVSSQYRVASNKFRPKLIGVFFDKNKTEYWTIIYHNNKKVKCYLDKYVNPLLEAVKRKQKRRKKQEVVTTPKQKMFEEEVRRYVLYLLGDENHKDFGHYCKVIAESKKACQGRSTCVSLQG